MNTSSNRKPSPADRKPKNGVLTWMSIEPNRRPRKPVKSALVSIHNTSSTTATIAMTIVIDLMREKSNENTSRLSSITSMKVLPSTVEPVVPSTLPTPSHDSRKKIVATTNVG